MKQLYGQKANSLLSKVGKKYPRAYKLLNADPKMQKSWRGYARRLLQHEPEKAEAKMIASLHKLTMWMQSEDERRAGQRVLDVIARMGERQ